MNKSKAFSYDKVETKKERGEDVKMFTPSSHLCQLRVWAGWTDGVGE